MEGNIYVEIYYNDTKKYISGPPIKPGKLT